MVEHPSCPWALVMVLWEDAFDGENGWCDVQHYRPDPQLVWSVGWLWPNCLEGYVTITGSFMPDEVPDLKTVGMPTHIPKNMVKRVVLLSGESEPVNS